MEGLNKVIALFVGLFVVLLIIGFVLGRFKNLAPKTATNQGAMVAEVTPTPTPEGQKDSGFLNRIFNSRKPSPTPTPTVAAIVVTNPSNTQIIEHVVENKDGTITVTKEVPSSIPATGAETIPLIISSLAGGVFLLKKTRLS